MLNLIHSQGIYQQSLFTVLIPDRDFCLICCSILIVQWVYIVCGIFLHISRMILCTNRCISVSETTWIIFIHVICTVIRLSYQQFFLTTLDLHLYPSSLQSFVFNQIFWCCTFVINTLSIRSGFMTDRLHIIPLLQLSSRGLYGIPC